MPKADAIVVAPATFHTINTWALGIGDTLKADLARHPAFSKNLDLLQERGVHVL